MGELKKLRNFVKSMLFENGKEKKRPLKTGDNYMKNFQVYNSTKTSLFKILYQCLKSMLNNQKSESMFKSSIKSFSQIITEERMSQKGVKKNKFTVALKNLIRKRYESGENLIDIAIELKCSYSYLRQLSSDGKWEKGKYKNLSYCEFLEEESPKDKKKRETIKN